MGVGYEVLGLGYQVLGLGYMCLGLGYEVLEVFGEGMDAARCPVALAPGPWTMVHVLGHLETPMESLWTTLDSPWATYA